eukprot:scaffold7303_cov153-Amphora_coffeaeformis.AAC.5
MAPPEDETLDGKNPSDNTSNSARAKRRRLNPPTETAPADEWSAPEEEDEYLDDASRNNTMTSSVRVNHPLNGETKQRTNTSLPKIGPNHQVEFLPDVGTEEENSTSNADMLWDPSRATQNIWAWLDSKPCREDEMLVLRALQECDYDVDAAKSWLTDNVEVGVDPNVFFEVFANTQLGKQKKFKAIAEMFGTSMSRVLTSYYLWKGRRPEEYRKTVKVTKEHDDGQSDSPRCTVCGEVGNLTQCSGECKRNFHPKCVKLDSFPSDNWLCSKCRLTRSEWTGAMTYLRVDDVSYLLTVPITPGKGLGLKVVVRKGRAAISETLRPDVPSEMGHGDCIIAINDVSVEDQTCKQIKALLMLNKGRISHTLKMRRGQPCDDQSNAARAETLASVDSQTEPIAIKRPLHEDAPTSAKARDCDSFAITAATNAASSNTKCHEDTICSQPSRDGTLQMNPSTSQASVSAVACGGTEYDLYFPLCEEGYRMRVRKRGGQFYLDGLSAEVTGFQGWKEGDRILKVDGVDLTNMEVKDAASLLGKVGSPTGRVVRLQSTPKQIIC